MDKALYHPEHGYYASGNASLGKEGDYFTNVCVGRIYGDLIGKQIEQMWEHLGSPSVFAIVEQGAHHGRFANDLLSWMHHFSPSCYEALRYWIIEPSENLRKIQSQTLEAWPTKKLHWLPNLQEEDTGSIIGVHFSNELLDAMPVHLVTKIGGEWMENFVDCRNGNYRYVYMPPSTKQLENQLENLPADLPEGYKTEVNTAALRWTEDIARVFHRGYVLAVDYGFNRADYYHPDRVEGTLSCYAQQKRSADPFRRIGLCDMTAHVDWTSLSETAENAGLDLCGFADQHHFIVGLGQEDLLALERGLQEMTQEVQDYVRTFKMLMHPETMGTRFQAICFGKNIDPTLPLHGFGYAGDFRRALWPKPIHIAEA